MEKELWIKVKTQNEVGVVISYQHYFFFNNIERQSLRVQKKISLGRKEIVLE